MANGPDFGDIVAQGILEGFRGISPYIENQQKLAMLREDRAFQQYVTEENLALAQAADLRDKMKTEASLEESRARIAQAEAAMKRGEELLPLEKSRIEADIDASKAATATSNLQASLLQDEKRLKDKSRAARESLVNRMRESVSDPELLDFLDAYASNPEFKGNEIYEAVQAKTRELSAPHLIKAIAEGRTPFRPEAADVLALQFKLNGRVDTERLASYLDTDKLQLKNMLLDTIKEVTADNPDITLGEMVPTILGMANVVDSQLEKYGVIQGKGKGKKVSPIIDSLDKSPADEPEDPKEAQAKVLGKPSGEPPATPLELAASGEGLGAGLRGGLKSDDLARATYLKENVEPTVLDLSKNQPKELQTITALALSGGSLGKFSGAFAALAPGIVGGTPEDRLGAFAASDEVEGIATFQGPEPFKTFDESLLLLNNMREDQKSTLQQKLDKMNEIFNKHLFKNGQNLMGDPEAENRAYKEFENFLAFSDPKSGRMIFRAGR